MDKQENEHRAYCNTLDAIPWPPAAPLPAIKIYERARKLNPYHYFPFSVVRDMLAAMALKGNLERTKVKHYYCYRWKDGAEPPISREKPPLVKEVKPSYNGRQRNEFSLGANVDWFLGALSPLRFGKPVVLWMIHPPTSTTKKTAGPKRDRTLVVICPGSLIGLPQGSFLISVVGSGSCVVKVDESGQAQGVANLVLARVPANLAKALISAIRKVSTTHQE
jgi:hypothetical protein